jgi:iron complex transport system substrate-binding protein
MKKENRILALVEIAIMLCSVFLVAIPAIAADQNMQKVSASEVTTTSEDDYVLGIYGNANEDDTIDMRDLTYVKLIFFGKKSETELADAKYDGKINPLDFIQIKLIIVGKEKELTIVDTADRIVTVKKPLKRMVLGTTRFVEAMRSLKQEKDKLVGVSGYVIDDETFFPEFSDYPNIGYWPADIEKIVSLTPDVVFLYASYQKDEREKLEDAGITVLCFDLYRPGDIYVEEIGILGYLVDKRQEAGEFIDWNVGYMNTIHERVEGLSKDEKPKIYYEAGTYGTYTESSGWKTPGGINIAADLSEADYVYDVDPEWVVKQNPDIIIKQVCTGVTGYTIDDTSEVEAVRDEIMSRPELADVTAVKEGKVYCINVGTSCSVFGHAYCAKWVQPELFEDLDPKAIFQEYIDRFQHLDYDLDKHGVFVYHPEDHPDGK